MAEGGRGSGQPAQNGAQMVQIRESSLAGLATSILEDCLHNIIHDIVLTTHRSEKVLRMNSAAVQAINQAQSTANESSTAKNSAISQGQPPQIRVETDGAVYENGRVTLKDNPLKTTPDVYCPQCRQPRLQYPLMGQNARTPDLSLQWCTLHPFINMPGHDVYGNPFPTDPARTKKERELLKQQARAEKDGTPGSQNTETGQQTPDERDGAPGANGSNGSVATAAITAAAIQKIGAGSGKPAHYIPWHTCPNCKRSLLITRFAQHLDKCLGIGGRMSSRNAMARMSGAAATGSSTPLGTGSRTGSPAPKRGGNDDDDDEVRGPKKKRNGLVGSGLARREKEKEKGSGIKLTIKAGSKGRDANGESSGTVKREREEGEESETPRKKIKLGKESSVVSDAAGEEANGADNASIATTGAEAD